MFLIKNSSYFPLVSGLHYFIFIPKLKPLCILTVFQCFDEKNLPWGWTSVSHLSQNRKCIRKWFKREASVISWSETRYNQPYYQRKNYIIMQHDTPTCTSVYVIFSMHKQNIYNDTTCFGNILIQIFDKIYLIDMVAMVTK